MSWFKTKYNILPSLPQHARTLLNHHTYTTGDGAWISRGSSHQHTQTLTQRDRHTHTETQQIDTQSDPPSHTPTGTQTKLRRITKRLTDTHKDRDTVTDTLRKDSRQLSQPPSLAEDDVFSVFARRESLGNLFIVCEQIYLWTGGGRGRGEPWCIIFKWTVGCIYQSCYKVWDHVK